MTYWLHGDLCNDHIELFYRHGRIFHPEEVLGVCSLYIWKVLSSKILLCNKGHKWKEQIIIKDTKFPVLCVLGVSCLVRGHFSMYATLQPEVFMWHEPERFDSFSVWTRAHLRAYPWGGGHSVVLTKLLFGRYCISRLLSVAFSVLNFLPSMYSLPRCSKDDSVSYPTY